MLVGTRATTLNRNHNNSKLLTRHSKAKLMATAYSRALSKLYIKRLNQSASGLHVVWYETSFAECARVCVRVYVYRHVCMI